MARSTTNRAKPQSAKLTASEREWLDKVQALLSACPSSRLGFYTIGDTSVSVYDRSMDKEISEYQERHDRAEFSAAVSAVAGGDLGTLNFPNPVHSTAG